MRHKNGVAVDVFLLAFYVGLAVLIIGTILEACAAG